MAAGRAQVGLRRRGPGLNGPVADAGAAARPIRARRSGFASAALALVVIAAVLLPAACSSTAEESQARFDLYRENAQNYYDRGDYVRSLHQAEQALLLQPDHEGMRLVKGFALLKLGSTSRNGVLLDQALTEFRALDTGFSGTSDFRVHLGLGTTHLACAFQCDREIERIERNLKSDFLGAEGRRDEENNLARLRSERADHLKQAEAELRRTLDDPLRKDNAYAITDLALVIQSEGGREAEAIALAERALKLLDESNRITRANLDKNASLGAPAKLDLKKVLETNAEKERALRDLIATIHWDQGDAEGFLAQMKVLEDRALMGEVQYWNRAGVYEAIGRKEEAAKDLETFLRLRAQHLDYEHDDKAPEAFRRIAALRGTVAGTL